MSLINNFFAIFFRDIQVGVKKSTKYFNLKHFGSYLKIITNTVLSNKTKHLFQAQEEAEIFNKIVK